MFEYLLPYIGPVAYVTLPNWILMFTPDFINFRWHVHNAISLLCISFCRCPDWTILRFVT